MDERRGNGPAVRHRPFNTMTTTLKLAVSAGAALVAGPHSSHARSGRRRSRRMRPAVTSSKHMLFRVRGPNGATVYLLGSVHLLSAEAAKLPPTSTRRSRMRRRSRSRRASTRSAARDGDDDARPVQNGATLRSCSLARRRPRSTAAPTVRADGRPGQRLQAMVRVDAADADRHAARISRRSTAWTCSSTRARSRRTSRWSDSSRSISSLACSTRCLRRIRNAWCSRATDRTRAKRARDDQGCVDPRRRAALDSLLNRGAEAPTLFATLVSAQRAWIPKIEELMQGGDDALSSSAPATSSASKGVVEMLRAKGYTVEQM